MKLRKANISDCLDLFQWRNHEKTRKNSFNDSTITWEKHCAWFKERVNSATTVIYVAEENDRKIGNIRFDIKNEGVFVSVGLNPDFMGKGLGAKVIKEGTELFAGEPLHNFLTKIFAEIKLDNIASQKAFLKAGYTEKERIDTKILMVKDNEI